MPTSRPRSGPASQSGQPPARAGTNEVGRVAAPAAMRKALATTPARPAAPSHVAHGARRAPLAARAPAAARPAISSWALAGRAPVGACIRPLLRLLGRGVCFDARRPWAPVTSRRARLGRVPELGGYGAGVLRQ